MNDRKIRWKIGLAILFALAISLVVWLTVNTYLVEESVVILGVVAAMVIAALLLLIAFVLLQQGVRLGMLWLKARLLLVTGLINRHRTAMVRPPLPR